MQHFYSAITMFIIDNKKKIKHVCICEFFSLRHCKVVKVSINHVILVIHVTKSGKENMLFQYS
jgi:hypothetical protein